MRVGQSLFGSVSLFEETLLVGAPGDASDVSSVGAAYIYQQGGRCYAAGVNAGDCVCVTALPVQAAQNVLNVAMVTSNPLKCVTMAMSSAEMGAAHRHVRRLISLDAGISRFRCS